jgi:predicted CXXCH cytochrome family protein
VFSQLRITANKFVFFVLFLMLFTSCDPVKRHETLVFFFDGVPPLGSETAEVEEDILTAGSEDEETVRRPRQVVFLHEPYQQCSRCHGELEQQGFSRQMELAAPVPNLCYECHDDYTESAVVVHGPVALGQCIFCHDPHQSKNEHLVKRPEPELCYFCHDVSVIESIDEHQTEALLECTNCHDAHSSENQGLLKNEQEMESQLEAVEFEGVQG